MALPSLEHTWRFKVNQAYATSGVALTDNRTLLLGIKNALTSGTGWTDSSGAITTLSNPWTVVASSNSITANSADNWSNITNLVWNSGYHSWIVLRQSKINDMNIELCIDLNVIDSSGYQLSLISSLGEGFDVSSPSTLTRPTATDEVVHLASAGWLTNNTSPFSSVLNIEISDDGYCNRLWIYVANVIKCFWQFDRPKETVTGWTNPAINTMCSTLEPTYAVLNDVARGYIKATNFLGKTGNANCYYTTSFYVSGTVGERQTTVNSLSNAWPFTSIGLASMTTGFYGRHGKLSDIWFGSTTPANGDTYPSSGTLKQFVQAGDIILPWNQSTPVTT
jgi:hypothetical protein